jgi:hypothetical protein
MRFPKPRRRVWTNISQSAEQNFVVRTQSWKLKLKTWQVRGSKKDKIFTDKFIEFYNLKFQHYKYRTTSHIMPHFGHPAGKEHYYFRRK